MHIIVNHLFRVISLIRYLWIFCALSALSLFQFYKNKTFKFKLHKPEKISAKDWDEIVKLHQSEFNISRDEIINLAKSRDRFLVYRNKNNKIIGTCGISTTRMKRDMSFYLGNAIIDKDYRGAKITAHALRVAFIYTIPKGLFKRKYNMALTANPLVYSLYSKNKLFWPSELEVSPNLHALMYKTLNVVSPTQYNKIEGNNFISTRLRVISKESAPQNVDIKSGIEKEFEKYNKNFRLNEQILIAARVTFMAELRMICSIMGNRLPTTL